MRNSNRNSVDIDFKKYLPDQASIDPVCFFIGGIGAVGVGGVADGFHRNYAGDAANRQENEFANSTIRSMTNPVRCAIRFIIGGFVYVMMDSIILKMRGERLPFAAGAVTGMLTACDPRPGVFLGCTLGMAVFCHFADLLYNNYKA